MPQQPNLVYIFTDQQSASAMSCAGNPWLHTPAMDRLAAQGVRFDLAYCANPICTPSRAAMFSGRMPHEVGVMTNGEGLPEDRISRSLGRLLQDAGYVCGYAGKWHLPGGAPGNDLGFEGLCGQDDLKLADAAIEFIQRDHDKPFFLVASYDNPHNICEWARNQPTPWGEIEDRPTDQCPPLPANFARMPDDPDMLEVYQRSVPNIYPTVYYSDDRWRHYRNAYFRMCEIVDAQIGRILDALDATGKADNTVVIFSSDHGDGHGAHHWNQKSALWEEVIRIPFIVSDPRGAAAGHVDQLHLINNGLDLMPTLCDYAGAAVPDDVHGHSVRPLLEGRDPGPWRDAVVSQSTLFQGKPRIEGRMLRTGRWKYCVYHIGQNREQLFDLETDPGEMVNLAKCDRYGSRLQACRDRLVAWCAEHNDPFPPRW